MEAKLWRGKNAVVTFYRTESGSLRKSLHTMKLFVLILSLLIMPIAVTVAEDLDGRSAFASTPGRDVGAALKRAGIEKKLVLVFVVDPGKKQAPHLQATMQAEETKKLVKEQFLVVIIPKANEKHVAGLVDDVVSVHPAYVVFKPDGTVVAKGDAAMGAGNGLKWIQQLVATP